MESEAPRLTAGPVIFAVGFGCAPMALWLTLNFLRPDLIAPMLGHLFGYILTGTELLLVLGGVLVYLAAAVQRGTGGKVALSIAGLILCTLPAAFLMLFGPVVFAFTSGNFAR